MREVRQKEASDFAVGPLRGLRCSSATTSYYRNRKFIYFCSSADSGGGWPVSTHLLTAPSPSQLPAPREAGKQLDGDNNEQDEHSLRLLLPFSPLKMQLWPREHLPGASPAPRYLDSSTAMLFSSPAPRALRGQTGRTILSGYTNLSSSGAPKPL